LNITSLGAGPLEVAGEAQQAVAEVLSDQWNADGGILGRPVVFTTENDQGDVQKCSTLVSQDLQSQKFDFLTAWECGVPAAAAIKDANVTQVGWDDNTAYLDLTTYPNYWNVAETFDPVATGMLSYLVNTLHYTKIAIVHDNFGHPQYMTDSFTKIAAAKFPTVTITGNEALTAGTLDTSPQLIKLQNGNPDVLVLIGFLPDIGQVLKDRVKIGWTVPVLGDPGVAGPNLVQTVGEQYLQNVLVIPYKVGITPATGSVPANITDFLNKVKAKLGVTTLPSPAWLYLQVHDLYTLMKVAADGAGSTDTAAMSTWLGNISSHPPAAGTFFTGDMNFSPTVHFMQNANALGISKADSVNADGFYTYYADLPSQ
jgi:branched-chain amino acid transport system substrate-binding protein